MTLVCIRQLFKGHTRRNASLEIPIFLVIDSEAVAALIE
jgi:hypothetical protein